MESSFKQLIGIDVETKSGEKLGKVEDIYFESLDSLKFSKLNSG